VATAAAKRYARAVFELAQQDGQLEQWARRLERIRELFADPHVAAVLNNPTIATDRREAFVADAPHPFDEEATNLAESMRRLRSKTSSNAWPTRRRVACEQQSRPRSS